MVKNNMGFSFIPVVILVFVIGLVSLFSLNFFQKKNENSVLQFQTKELNFNFYYSDSNKKIIEVIITGSGSSDFINNISTENRVEQVKIDGKKEIIKYASFRRDAKGDFRTTFPVISEDVIYLNFFDIKLSSGKVQVDGIKPWSYNSNSNRLERIVPANLVPLNITFKDNGFPNTGVLNFNFIEDSSVLAANSLANEIRNNGVVVGTYCIEIVCSNNIVERTLKPRILKTKDGFNFSINTDTLTQYVYIPMKVKEKLVIRNIPEGWQINTNKDGINEISTISTVVDFNSNNPTSVSFTLSGHSTQFYELLRDIKIRGVDKSDCNGDKCTTTTIKPRLNTTNKFFYTFSVPVTPRTTSISFKTNARWSNGFIWERQDNKIWKVNSKRLGIERFSPSLPPKIVITERKIDNTSSSYFFTITGSGSQYDSLVASLKQGVKGDTLYYPSRSSCNNSSYGTCQFEIITPSTNKSFQFYSDIRSSFNKIPVGWKVNTQGTGIFK